MKRSLKTDLEALQEITTKVDNSLEKEFRGAGIVTVTVPTRIGKALGLEKDYVGSKKQYVLGRVSTNGSIGEVEDTVTELIKEYKLKGVEATQHTYLT